MDKRGDEELLKTVGYVAVILIAAGILIYWINTSATGESVRDATISKQAALLIDAARPGSTIFIDKKFTIEGNSVKSGQSKYEFFSEGSVTYRSVQGGTEITIG